MKQGKTLYPDFPVISSVNLKSSITEFLLGYTDFAHKFHVQFHVQCTDFMSTVNSNFTFLNYSFIVGRFCIDWKGVNTAKDYPTKLHSLNVTGEKVLMYRDVFLGWSGFVIMVLASGAS